MHNNNVDDATIIFYSHIAKSDDDKTTTIKILCGCLQDATATILYHVSTSSANTPRLSMASMPKMVCKYTKKGVYLTKDEYGKYAKEASFVKEGDNEPFAKEGDNKPVAQNGGWAGYNNDPLATKGNWAVCIMQGNDNEPLTTISIRAAYVMQGNDEPLATDGNWATTIDNCKGVKAPAIDYSKHDPSSSQSSTIVPAIKLIPLQPPLQQMCKSKFFMS